MKINSNLKRFNSLREFILFSVLILYASASPYAAAGDIENLQKNASMTYERMVQARQNAETLTKDLTFAERKLATAKQKLAEAEQAAETARKKSEQAKISMEKAIRQWQEASDALANEWGKTEVK
jgi:septal ring factor EnvC (AmiA/AmiB activator)